MELEAHHTLSSRCPDLWSWSAPSACGKFLCDLQARGAPPGLWSSTMLDCGCKRCIFSLMMSHRPLKLPWYKYAWILKRSCWHAPTLHQTSNLAKCYMTWPLLQYFIKWIPRSKLKWFWHKPVSLSSCYHLNETVLTHVFVSQILGLSWWITTSAWLQ